MLVFIYFLLILVATRLLDLILWYQHGLAPTQVVNPFMLKVKQIKLLLDSRGVSYTEYFERNELVQLLEDSADVMVGEVEQVSERTVPLRERLKPGPVISHFSGGAHFYEQVEDTRDSVWLVQVVTSDEPLLDDYNWRLVCGQLEPFGVRIGIFDCRQDFKLCETKGWAKPLLLLAMPKGQKAKDKVILQPFTSSKPQVIVNWVHQQLSLWVKRIQTIEEVESDWLSENGTDSIVGDEKVVSKSDSGANNVRVLLLSHLLQPPLFLAALSIKFTGRVSFGMFAVKKEDTESVRKRLRLNDKKLPVYFVVTPEKKVIYGSRKLEYFNMWSMNVFLCGIQPETNDVFLCSLLLINMLVGLTVCLTSTRLWWRWTAYSVWALVKYNFWLFTAWLVFLALARFAVFGIVTNRLLLILRLIGLSGWGSFVRTEVALLTLHPLPFLFSFISFSLCVCCLIRLFAPSWLISSPDDFELDPRPWWVSLSRPMRASQLDSEDGIEMLIERLAVPNFWLQPVIPMDYIKDLPVWRYHGWNVVDGQTEAPGCAKDKLMLHSASPKLLEHLMDAEDPQNFLLCCCVCSQNQPVTHSMNSYSCSQGHACSHSRSGCTFSQGSAHPHSHVQCTCPRGPNCSHSTCNLKTTLITPTLETSAQHSQCFCSLVPGWSGAPTHNCQGPFRTPDQCQNCLDSCENLRNGRSRQAMCVACAHRCMSSQWYGYNSCHLQETDLDESDFSDSDHISWNTPQFILPTTDCAVCLESYNYGSVLCGLPCGHNYHQRCILAWLQRDNHHCPVCRWPAYRTKSVKSHLHQE